MSFRFDRLARAVVVLLVAACVLCAPAGAKEDSPQGYDGNGSAYQPGGDSQSSPTPPVAPGKRKKLVDSLERKLGRLKPEGTSKKDLNDYYMLGTADLNLRSRHADVCFSVKQGQRAVAEFITDYMLTQPDDTRRQWHVFYRMKDPEQAEQALQLTRSQYDRMQSYRAQIRKIYRAKTTRRC